MGLCKNNSSAYQYVTIHHKGVKRVFRITRLFHIVMENGPLGQYVNMTRMKKKTRTTRIT